MWQREKEMEKNFRFIKPVIRILILLFYLAAIFYLTLLNREPEPERMAWTTLFGSYRRAWEENHTFILWGLIDNVIMMIPFGFLLTWVNGKIRLVHTLFLACVLTVFIESTQYLTKLGYFDVDDIWNNLWGTVIGYGLYCCLKEFAAARKEGRRVRCLLLVGGILPLIIFLLFFAFFLKMVLIY